MDDVAYLRLQNKLMTTYIVICIALIIFVTVILIAAKPIIKGFEARQNIKNFDNIEKKIQVSNSEKIERNNNGVLGLVKKHKIDPKLCVFIEDIARNLKPAYEMGMKTVWIENDEPWAKEFSNSNFINYKTNNLSGFLKKINLAKIT